MRSEWAILVTAFWCMGYAQTPGDLRTQTKNVDSTAANTTKPHKSGPVLPVTCSVGEAYLKSNAPGGSNVYRCTSPNSWTLEAGTPGPALPPATTNELRIAVNGVMQGSQSILNLIVGGGITVACSNNSAAKRVDCMLAVDTAYVLSRARDQAGTDKSAIATSGGRGGTFVAALNPVLMAYTENQTFSFIASDHPCAGNDTLNIGALGPIPLKKISGGALVSVMANDCLLGIPYLIRAHGNPVDAWVIQP